MGRLVVRVRPGARRTEFVGWFGDIPQIAVAAPAVGGAANDELVRALARLFGVPPRDVRLVGGAGSRTKRIDVDRLDDAALRDLVERLNPGSHRSGDPSR